MSEDDPTGALPRGDQLAVERTMLANERTFLAYFRTAVVFLSSGIAILSMDFFSEIRGVAWLFIGLSPLALGTGIWRTKRARDRIQRSARLTEAKS